MPRIVRAPHRVTVQLEKRDCTALQSFVTEFEHQAFENEGPPEQEQAKSWQSLATAWFAGSSLVTSWLSPSFSPDNDVVLSLGKKHPAVIERVSVQTDEPAVKALRDTAKLLEQAFQLETS